MIVSRRTFHIMQTTGNTILITGGGSGIGRALAAAFHSRGNQVVITGRRPQALAETAAAYPGMLWRQLDIQNADAIRQFAIAAAAEFPSLNVLINNAGIMLNENLRAPSGTVAEETIATNLLGPIRLTAALLPHLLTRPAATVLNVTSGLAFVPLAVAATYCATKAAMHSYTQSLRYQLQGSAVKVVEIIPPYVQTELQGERQASDPRAMPLADYIAETMRLLEGDPAAEEVLVDRVKPVRFAEADGKHASTFAFINGLFPMPE